MTKYNNTKDFHLHWAFDYCSFLCSRQGLGAGLLTYSILVIVSDIIHLGLLSFTLQKKLFSFLCIGSDKLQILL